MHALNRFLFVLSALCFSFLAVDANAAVCFTPDGDRENCGGAANFSEYTDPSEDLKTQCGSLGYKWSASNPCPTGTYKSDSCPLSPTNWLCCGNDYAHQACLFPLEEEDKCGSRYKCRCPEDYKITSELAKTNNCIPSGGVCMMVDGTADKVLYTECTCDTGVFTTKGTNCPNNQTYVQSCTDDTNTTHVRCYCDRNVYPKSSCEYGFRTDLGICRNSEGAEFGKECKTARDKCFEEGFKAAEPSECPNIVRQDSKIGTSSGQCKSQRPGSTASSACVLGEACPYPTNPPLYKCAFDEASWCKNNGYTQISSTPINQGSTCIDTASGLSGKVKVCTEDDGKPSVHYKCELTCAQRAQLGVTNTLDLKQDQRLANAGIVAYYNVIGSVKNLYVAKGGVVPTANKTVWQDIADMNYTSINGVGALCDRNSGTYSECCKERESYSNRPVLQFDGMKISQTTTFFSRNMSDINIQIYSSDTTNHSGYGEEYKIGDNVTWNNVTVSANGSPNRLCIEKHSNSEVYYPMTGDNCSGDWRGNLIKIYGNVTLTFKGTSVFQLSATARGSCSSSSTSNGHTCIYDSGCAFDKNGNNTGKPYFCNGYYDPFITSKTYEINPTRFWLEKTAKVVFKNATIIDSYGETDWDGGGGGTMLIYNSKGNLGRVWSYWNIGLENSDIEFGLLRIKSIETANNTFGGYDDDKNARYRCHGVYANNSTVKSFSNWGKLEESYAKIYLGYGSKLDFKYPIRLGGANNDIVCVNSGASAVINGKSMSGRGFMYGTGSTPSIGQYYVINKNAQNWYNRFGSSICTSSESYGPTHDGHDYAFYPGNSSSGGFCSACYTCERWGMGYY